MRRAAVGVLALVTACSGSPALVPAADVGLTGRLIQYRDDLARRYVQVQVTSSRPVQVVDVTLRLHGFAPPPTRSTGARLGAHDRVDLPLPYGDADCGREAGADAVLTVRAQGGTRRVRLPLVDAGALLGRLHRAACAEQALRAQVDLVLGPDVAVAGETATFPLALVRRSGRARVAVTGLGGNIIYDETLRGPLVLEPGQQRASTTVRAVARRCDDHALTESKETAVVRVPVSVDGAPPLLLRVPLPPPAARTLVRSATESCARTSPRRAQSG